MQKISTQKSIFKFVRLATPLSMSEFAKWTSRERSRVPPSGFLRFESDVICDVITGISTV
jgi:hypothetical protein